VNCPHCGNNPCPPRPALPKAITTGELDEAERAEAIDQHRHNVWLWHETHDPHRLNHHNTDQQTRQELVGWHRARIKAISRTVRSLAMDDLPVPSTLTASLKHHERVVAELLAALPKQKPQRVVETPKKADPLAEIRKYAHNHGLSIAQAKQALEKR